MFRSSSVVIETVFAVPHRRCVLIQMQMDTLRERHDRYSRGLGQAVCTCRAKAARAGARAGHRPGASHDESGRLRDTKSQLPSADEGELCGCASSTEVQDCARRLRGTGSPLEVGMERTGTASPYEYLVLAVRQRCGREERV